MADSLARLQPSGLSRLERLKLAVRSYWMGPISSSDHGARDFFGGHQTSTGLDVNEFTALNYSAVFAAVGLISSQVGNLPLLLYRKVGEGKERFERHPLYRLIHDRPNPDMSAFVFRETLQAHVLTWGNGYAEIQRDGAGRPSALWPITPDRVTPFRRGSDAALEYRVVNRDGNDVFIPSADMLHVPGHGFDGICGYSVIAKMRESVALGLASERFGGTFFGNGAQFGGVISVPTPRPNELVVENDRKAINAKHQGVDKAHRFLMLYNNATYTRLGIPPNDAQFLETRQFQIAEIARWFNLPPHKLKELSRSTNNNIEHQNLEYYIDCLAPWLEKWEQELCEKLIAPLERTQQSIEFVADGLLRGDAASRGEFKSKEFTSAMLTPDEGRRIENRNPIPGGSDAYVALNLIPLSLAKPYYEAQIEAIKAKATADLRPPPTPGPTADQVQQQKQREQQLIDERDTARRVAQEAEDTRDRIASELTAAQVEAVRLATELDVVRATHTAEVLHLTGSVEAVRADLVATRQACEAERMLTQAHDSAKETALAERAALAVELARVQMERDAIVADLATAQAEATRHRDEGRAALEFVSTERDAADLVVLETRASLATMTSERDAALLVIAERTSERDAITLTLAAASQQIESLSLDVTVAQADREATDGREVEVRAALQAMTAQAHSLGTDLIAAQHDLAASVERAQMIEADYQRVCAEKTALSERADAAEALAGELRGQLASTTDAVGVLATERAAALEQHRIASDTVTERDARIAVLEADAIKASEARTQVEDAQRVIVTELRAQVDILSEHVVTLTADRDAARDEHRLAVAGSAERDAALRQARDAHAHADEVQQAIVTELRAQAGTVTQELTAASAALLTATARIGELDALHAEDVADIAKADQEVARQVATVRSLTTRVTETQQAVRGVLIDAVQRGLVTRETDRARKQMTPDKLSKWVETFYPMHEDVCRTVLRPAVKAWLVASGVDVSVDVVLDRVIPAYIGESTRALRGVLLETDVENLPSAVERVCRRWETERADALADRIMKDVA